MPEYRLEWQETKEIKGGAKITINLAKDIVISNDEENPDEIAKKWAEKMFKKLPESIFTATLKKWSPFSKKSLQNPNIRVGTAILFRLFLFFHFFPLTPLIAQSIIKRGGFFNYVRTFALAFHKT